MIDKLLTLAALLPIVASVGGNAGNQSVALVLQSLSQRPLQLQRFLLRELCIGAMNGAVWGTVLGLASLLLVG